MRSLVLYAFAWTFVICQFCHEDFVSIGRHSWRCKRKVQPNRLNEAEHTPENPTIGNGNVVPPNAQQIAVNTEEIKCLCGKKCKGLRGLRAHQRRCRNIRTLATDTISNANDTVELVDEAALLEENVNIEQLIDETPDLKPGIVLPRSKQEWSTANVYFHATLPLYTV